MMVITGAGLIVSSSLVFWQLLPRDGRLEDLVKPTETTEKILRSPKADPIHGLPADS